MTASTPIETQKPLVKDEETSDVDVYLYRSMIGSLMYLTASRPDIMFAVCACSRFQSILAKAEPLVHKNPAFDELDDDEIDYMETEDAQDVGRTIYVVHEEKESVEKEVSTKDALNTNQPKVSTDRPDEGTDKEEVSTDRPDEGTVTPTTPIPTHTIFGDDETIAQVLLNMSQVKAVSREKEKGVELKDVENIERSRPTST
ncbi:hypothetical protein Tco_0135859, partial [Tanacetum coccineum]